MRDHEIAQWLSVAERDVRSAVLLHNGNELETSYYHCTQAVEKYLKTYLIANNIEINYNHNISETLKKCVNNNTTFLELFDECNKMTANVNKLRYPMVMNIDKNHVKDGFSLIDKIKKLKPIQELYSGLIDKYGENWENVLFKQIESIETDASFR